jgi:uncharacterized protein YprB with RNaseH-like and TPR domain
MLLKERLQSLGYRSAPAPPAREWDLAALANELGADLRHTGSGQVLVVEELLPMPATRPFEADIAARLGVVGDEELKEDTLCFFDTETTGLSGGVGNQVFLIALAWRRRGGLLLRQYLLPDPASEQPFLEALVEDLAASGALVSYNGRAFDVPVLEGRLVLARRDTDVIHRSHLDLLYPARRIFRARIGHCNLGNVETQVLGRDRGDDIPGYLIPDMYLSYLRSRDPRSLRAVLLHNRQDVVSLSLLLDHLCTALRYPHNLHPLDRLGVAAVLEKAGEGETAARLYRSMWEESAGGWDGDIWPGTWTPVELGYVVGMRLAAAYRRLGEQAATDVLVELCRRHPTPWEAGIMLAKELEHRRKDRAGALEVVEATLAALQTFGPHNNHEERCVLDLRYRAARLHRRIDT